MKTKTFHKNYIECKYQMEINKRREKAFEMYLMNVIID